MRTFYREGKNRMETRAFRAFQRSYRFSAQGQAAYFAYVADLLAAPQVQSLARYEQHFEINRLQHVLSVSYMAYLICGKLGGDAALAARSGILHDLYYYDWRVKDPRHHLHGIYHPGFSLKNARKLCGVLDPQMENAILRHMWPLTPALPRGRVANAVSLADKYCAFYECVISFSPKFREKFCAALERDFPAPAGISLLASQKPEKDILEIIDNA